MTVSDRGAGSTRLSRRDAIRMGAFGLGGLALGVPLLSACRGDDPVAAGAKERIKAHWVYIGPVADDGWTQAHDLGRREVEAMFGDRVETGFTENVGFDAATTDLYQQLVDDGNDIIFATTEYADLMTGVADANPHVKFCEINGDYYSDNVFPFYLAHEISAYLLGVAAGHLADNGRIGYIGAFPSPVTYNDVNGLLLGARSVNADAVVEAVLVGSYFDPDKNAEASDQLLGSGAEFLFGVAVEPTYVRLAEQAGVWTAYWNLDFRSAAPTKYVNNFDLSKFGTFYVEQCRRVLEGTWRSQQQVWMLDCPLGEWGPNVPQNAQDSVAEAAAAIADGSLQVYNGPLRDNLGVERLPAGESLDSIAAYELDWAVEGVTGV